MTLKWFTDNQAVPSIVHSGSMKEHLHILALDIFQTARDNKIDIAVEWIPRTQNERADYLSKIVDLMTGQSKIVIFMLLPLFGAPAQ